jgi:hypothetical protein
MLLSMQYQHNISKYSHSTTQNGVNSYSWNQSLKPVRSVKNMEKVTRSFLLGDKKKTIIIYLTLIKRLYFPDSN